MASPIADASSPATLQFANLSTGRLPFEKLRADCESQLQRALDGIDADAVTLVLPHRLTTLLTHVFPRGLGALRKVRECIELTDELAKVQSQAVVYISFPQIDDIRAIATHAGLLHSVQSADHTFTLVVCGQWSSMCAEVFQQQRLQDAFHIVHATVGFMPIDADVVTLGRERCLFESVIHSNKSALDDLAAALAQLQRVYGEFDHIKSKGDLSAYVVHRLMNADNEPRPGHTKHHDDNGVKLTLVLLDRSVDFATALSNPLTFEALVDELMDSHDGFATLSDSDKVLPLNSSDPVYDRVRGLNIQAVSSSLNAQATAMKETFDRFRNTSASASAAEVHEFVKSVPVLKASQASLEKLVDVVETVERATSSHEFRRVWRLERAAMDFDPNVDVVEVYDEIEELIYRNTPMLTVLRLLCLLSITRDGIPRDQLLRLKMRFLQTYGHEVVFSFANLNRLGLLRMVDQRPTIIDTSTNDSPFATAAAALHAIDVDVDPLNPASMAFVTSGYAPLSCILVEELLKHGTWESADAAMAHIPGSRSEIKRLEDGKRKRKKGAKEAAPREDAVQVIVVCFVGGVSYTEIAALRWLSRYYPRHQIVIASTSVINGNSFLNEVLERIPSTT